MASKNFIELLEKLNTFFGEDSKLIDKKIDYLEKILLKKNRNEINNCGLSLRNILEITLKNFHDYINFDLYNNISTKENFESSGFKIKKICNYYGPDQNVVNSLHNLNRFSNSLLHFEQRPYDFKDLSSLFNAIRDIWVIFHWISIERLKIAYKFNKFDSEIYNLFEIEKVKLEQNILESNSATQIVKENFLNIILDKKIFYFVPPYQRNYDWSETNIEELLLDLERIIQNDFISSYFFGVLCFGKDNDQENLFSIIDGQQRITTILLMMRVIYDIYIMKNWSCGQLLEGLFKNKNDFLIYFLENRIDNVQTQKILKYYLLDDKQSLINEYFFQKGFYKESSIYINYHFIKEFILEKLNIKNNSSNYLDELVCAITKLEVGIIWFEKNINEFEIFENINSKSKQLTNYDKIKNFILSSIKNELYKKNHTDMITLFNNHIQNKFEDYFNANKIKDLEKIKIQNNFFSFYLNICNNEYEWKKDFKNDIYKRFKYFFEIMFLNKNNNTNNKIISLNEYKNFVVNLGKYLEVFLLSRNMNSFNTNDVLKPFISNIKIIKLNEIIFPIIANYLFLNGTFAKYDSKLIKLNNSENFIEIIKILEIHYIRRTVCSDRLMTLGKYVYKVIKAFNTNKISTSKDLWFFLLNDIDYQFQMIPENTFINFVARRPIDSKNMIKTILVEIENDFSNRNNINFKDFQLLPSNYTEEIINHLNIEKTNASYEKIRSEYPEYKDMIGNYFVAKNAKKDLIYKENYFNEYCEKLVKNVDSCTFKGINQKLSKLNVSNYNILNILNRSTEISQIILEYWGDIYKKI